MDQQCNGKTLYHMFKVSAFGPRPNSCLPPNSPLISRLNNDCCMLDQLSVRTSEVVSTHRHLAQTHSRSNAKILQSTELRFVL